MRAAARIFEAKARPSFDPLISHLADAADLPGLVGAVPPAVAALAERFWPGPLTLIVDRPAAIPPIVTSGLDTMAVRVPDEPSARALIAGAGRSLAPFDSDGRDADLVAVLYLVELAARYLRDRQAEAGARLGHVDTWLLPAVEEHLARRAR
ncbi:hypothetical protein GCM10027452_41050 [Micromonospora halotolerans]